MTDDKELQCLWKFICNFGVVLLVGAFCLEHSQSGIVHSPPEGYLLAMSGLLVWKIR